MSCPNHGNLEHLSLSVQSSLVLWKFILRRFQLIRSSGVRDLIILVTVLSGFKLARVRTAAWNYFKQHISYFMKTFLLLSFEFSD